MKNRNVDLITLHIDSNEAKLNKAMKSYGEFKNKEKNGEQEAETYKQICLKYLMVHNTILQFDNILIKGYNSEDYLQQTQMEIKNKEYKELIRINKELDKTLINSKIIHENKNDYEIISSKILEISSIDEHEKKINQLNLKKEQLKLNILKSKELYEQRCKEIMLLQEQIVEYRNKLINE